MDFTKSEIEEIRKWIHFNNKITKFQNSANAQMFNGFDSVSFKIKRKKLIQALKLF